MRIRAVALTVLFMISLASPLVSSDTVTTGDTDISGNYTMTGNYTVAKGTTLTIKPGSVIDMQSYWMEVEGTLIVNDATIMSSIQSTGIGSHNSEFGITLQLHPMGQHTYTTLQFQMQNLALSMMECYMHQILLCKIVLLE